MPGWLDQWFARQAPLRGRPAARRVKHYAALSGYAYEYTYEGYRETRGGCEYHFTVAPDRTASFALRVVLGNAPLAAWQQRHGPAPDAPEEREGFALSARERYAVAKLALFAAFDDAENPGRLARLIEPDAAEVEALLERLDL
jgi:hypothetical protein